MVLKGRRPEQEKMEEVKRYDETIRTGYDTGISVETNLEI